MKTYKMQFCFEFLKVAPNTAYRY